MLPVCCAGERLREHVRHCFVAWNIRGIGGNFTHFGKRFAEFPDVVFQAVCNERAFGLIAKNSVKNPHIDAKILVAILVLKVTLAFRDHRFDP